MQARRLGSVWQAWVRTGTTTKKQASNFAYAKRSVLKMASHTHQLASPLRVLKPSGKRRWRSARSSLHIGYTKGRRAFSAVVSLASHNREERMKRNDVLAQSERAAQKNGPQEEVANIDSQRILTPRNVSEKTAESMPQKLCTEGCKDSSQHVEAEKKALAAAPWQSAAFLWGPRRAAKRPLLSSDSPNLAYRVVAYANDKRRRMYSASSALPATA